MNVGAGAAPASLVRVMIGAIGREFSDGDAAGCTRLIQYVRPGMFGNGNQ